MAVGNANACYINPIRPIASATPVLVYNVATSEVTYNSSSARYKTNIQPANIDTSVITKLKLVTYDSILDPYPTGIVGFIAEDVSAIDTNLVWSDNIGPAGLDQMGMLYYLIDHTKNLTNRVTQLETLLFNMGATGPANPMPFPPANPTKWNRIPPPPPSGSGPNGPPNGPPPPPSGSGPNGPPNGPPPPPSGSGPNGPPNGPPGPSNGPPPQ